MANFSDNTGWLAPQFTQSLSPRAPPLDSQQGNVSSLAFLSGAGGYFFASGKKKPNGKPLGELPVMSIENPVIYVPIRHLSSACPVRVSFTLMGSSPLYICREPSTNQLLFIQNKPNLLDAQMNVSSIITTNYENIRNWTLGQNKPNSNPISPKGQNELRAYPKIRPNSQPLSHRICLSRSGERRYNGCCPFCYKSLQIEKGRIFGRDTCWSQQEGPRLAGSQILRAYPNNREIRYTLYKNRESSYLRAYKAPLHLSRTLYKSTLFMQNKPNLRKSQMNLKFCKQMDYENISDWTIGENKTNQTQFQSSLAQTMLFAILERQLCNGAPGSLFGKPNRKCQMNSLRKVVQKC